MPQHCATVRGMDEGWEQTFLCQCIYGLCESIKLLADQVSSHILRCYEMGRQARDFYVLASGRGAGGCHSLITGNPVPAHSRIDHQMDDCFPILSFRSLLDMRENICGRERNLKRVFYCNR